LTIVKRIDIVIHIEKRTGGDNVKPELKSCADCIYLKSIVDEEKNKDVSIGRNYENLQWKHECRNVFLPTDVISLDTAKSCPHYEEDV